MFLVSSVYKLGASNLKQLRKRPLQLHGHIIQHALEGTQF